MKTVPSNCLVSSYLSIRGSEGLLQIPGDPCCPLVFEQDTKPAWDMKLTEASCSSSSGAIWFRNSPCNFL